MLHPLSVTSFDDFHVLVPVLLVMADVPSLVPVSAALAPFKLSTYPPGL